MAKHIRRGHCLVHHRREVQISFHIVLSIVNSDKGKLYPIFFYKEWKLINKYYKNKITPSF